MDDLYYLEELTLKAYKLAKKTDSLEEKSILEKQLEAIRYQIEIKQFGMPIVSYNLSVFIN